MNPNSSRPNKTPDALERAALWRAPAPAAARLRQVGRFLCQTANLMIGQPDYENYVAHRQANHPNEPIMSRTEFFRDREAARFGVSEGSGRMFRCC